MDSSVEGLMEPQVEGNDESTEEKVENEEPNENSVLKAKAISLIERITGNADNPSPKVLHALATRMETQEARMVITNSGRASTLVANDAATPTLSRIERDAITAGTPITYDSKELLFLIHEHLQAVGCSHCAALLLKVANLTPLPSFSAQSSSAHPCSKGEKSALEVPFPSGRAPSGFLVDKPKPNLLLSSSRKKHLSSSTVSGHSRRQMRLEGSPILSKCPKDATSKDVPVVIDVKWPWKYLHKTPSSPVKPSFQR